MHHQYARLLTALCHIAILLCITPNMALTASPASPPKPAAANIAKTEPASPQANQYSDFLQSLEKTMGIEKANMDRLKLDLLAAQDLEKAVNVELEAFHIQLSADNNLLLMPTAEIAELEKAQADLQNALNQIEARLKEIKDKKESVTRELQQTLEMYALNERQLADIKDKAKKNTAPRNILKPLRELRQVLSDKRDILGKAQDIYTNEINRLEQIQTNFNALFTKFVQQVAEHKNKSLFRRNSDFLALLGWKQFQEETIQVGQKIRMMFSASFWTEQIQGLWKSGGFLFVASLLLLGIIEYLLLRFRRVWQGLEQQLFFLADPRRCLALRLFQRSLLLMGTTLFIYIYAQVRLLYYTVPLIRVIVYVLLIWLFTKWGLDTLKFWDHRKDLLFPKRLQFRFQFLLFFVRAFAMAYVVVDWMIGPQSLILLLARLLFEMTLIGWSLSFWRIFRTVDEMREQGNSRTLVAVRHILPAVGYTVAGGGFLLELAGYGQLALHWYTSWGRTAVISLWGILVFFLLQAWDKGFQQAAELESEKSAGGAYPIRWLIIRLCWVAWFASLLMLAFIAWGPKQAIIVGCYRVLNYPIPIGEVRFRLLGLVYAFLILLVTYATSRLWRHILYDRIMARSGLEKGLQESITTISVYLLWAFGILIGLHAIGIGTTSIAVALGALGIGLGFGLQNIFNNFISGIILLFERPIQVGEVIEINGIWGTVSKINVRSTVVQTFDNASLIIPNSEFVSNQVVNWSFKDVRVRRSIGVGVAYGSNVELVRDTLLEIADANKQVLKYPRQDVLFTDFGDSSLNFQLRFWATIETFYQIETQIRFEIDRLFKERKIEIPFPQHDVHIRSVAKEVQIGVKPNV